MSLILDALNKADREREYRDVVPDLNTVHGTPRQRRDYRVFWLVGGLVAAFLMIVTLLVLVWLGRSEKAVAPADSVPVEEAATPAQVVQSTGAPEAKPLPITTNRLPNPTTEDALALVPQPAAAGVDTEVQALYQTQQDPQVIQVVEPQIQPALPQPTVITPEKPRRSSVDEELARSLWEESKRELQSPVPESALPARARPLSAPDKPAEEAKPLPADLPAEETLAGHSEVPFLHELPVSVQNTIPTLMYAKHEYEKGFVVINKEELQVGSAAQGGVLLERILADGVLLSLNGTEFKLSSLSSWVNY